MSYLDIGIKAAVTELPATGRTMNELAIALVCLPLKKKYRPNRATFPQWSTGGDYGGKGRPKGARTHGSPVVKTLVIGPTGKRRFEVVSDARRPAS